MNQEAHTYNPRYRAFMSVQAAIESRECPLFVRLESDRSGPLLKQCAGLSGRQLKLLRRLLYRASLDQLLRSRWLQRRVNRGVSVTREDMRNILHLARRRNVNWDGLLPERINLGSCESMVAFVLVPVLQWWESQYDEVAVTGGCDLARLQVHFQQLRAHEAFWRQALAVAPESSRVQLEGAGQRQLKVRSEIASLVSRLEALSHWSRQSWTHWERGMEHYLASGQLGAFHPVPLVLAPFWEALESLGTDTQAMEAVRTWLYERDLCREQDHLYWSSA